MCKEESEIETLDTVKHMKRPYPDPVKTHSTANGKITLHYTTQHFDSFCILVIIKHICKQTNKVILTGEMLFWRHAAC